ncbi:putative F-box domain-containing protein [Tanacetum coccineum]
MSDNIPYEIQLEIIKKVSETVDVKALIRFRSVSKRWMSFIDSPEFIAFYGVRQSQPHRLLLRYKEIINPLEFKYISFIDDVTFSQQQQDFPPNVSDLVKHLKYSKVIGSSCGLWCFHDYRSRTKMVVIWNPSIGKSVGIVVPRLLNNSPISPDHMQFTTLGFGVCPSTYDPTIVRMSYIERVLDIGDTNNIPWEVEVFTLSSKTWKMIPSSNLPRESVRLIYSTQVAIDRFIFWVAYDRIVGNDGVSQFKKLILSFDLITHEFKEVNLPDSIANRDISISMFNESLVVSAFTNEVNDGQGLLVHSNCGDDTSCVADHNFKVTVVDHVHLSDSIAKHAPQDISISELNESLVVSAYTNEVNDGLVYGIWMMGEEGGVMTSFKKLFTINIPDLSTMTLLGFRKNGEPIMESTKYEELAHINNFGINGETSSFFVCPYIETLLIDHSDGCIISNDGYGVWCGARNDKF